MEIEKQAQLAYAKALRGGKLTPEEIEIIVLAIKIKQASK